MSKTRHPRKTEAQPPSAAATPAPVPAQEIDGWYYTFAKDMNTYSVDIIRLADQKAQFVLLLMTGVMTVLIKSGWQGLLKEDWIQKYYCLTGLTAITFDGIGWLLALLTVLPRFGESAPQGVIFWRSVLHHRDAQAYRDAVLHKSAGGMALEMIQNYYHTCRICELKYRLLSAGVIFSGLGVILSLITLIIMKQ